MRLIFLFLFALAAALNSAHAQTALAFTSNATLPSSPAGSLASIPVQITGGTQPFTFTFKRGQILPAGLFLNNSTGVITGTPSRPSSTEIQVWVKDSSVPARTKGKNFILTISGDAPALPTFSLINPGAQVDKPFSFTFNATKGKTPYTFTTNSTLPAGLFLNNSTGTISGTPLPSAAPQSTTDYRIAVRVTGSNAIPQSSLRTYTLSVAPAPAPVISTKTIPDAEMGEEYYFDELVVTGGKPPYKFRAAAAFPPNLVIAEDGTISGIPKTAGTYRLKISATDANNRSRTAYVSLIISDAPSPKITTASPLYWTLNQTTGTTLAATGGKPPYKWAKIGSSSDPLRNLPSGVTLNPDGTFSGVPTAAGTFKVAIRATDDLGKGGTKTFSIIVASGSLAITSQSPLGAAYAGVSVNATLAATGGIAPYTWSLKNRGTLPNTITLNSTTGRLSGTANATGNFSFTAEVADSRNGTVAKAEKQLTLPVVNYDLAIVTTSLTAGTAGANYTAPLAATGGKQPYSWSFTSTPTLSGLSASTGNLTGKPAAAGNYTIALKVTDANAKSVTSNLTLRINEAAALAFDPLTLPNGKVATSYNGTLGAKGGFSPYTFTLKTGSILPPGLSLVPATGAITGKPTMAGTYKFTVVLKDAKTPTANTIEREFTIVIDSYGMSVSGPTTIVGKRYSAITPAQFTVLGGTANHTWSATPPLPTTLLLGSTTGLVSGNLTAALGNYTVAIKVTDRNAQSISRNVTVSITAPDLLVWETPATLPEGQVGGNYTAALANSGGKSPYAIPTLKAGSTLPSGLTLSAGKISGMPRVAGTYKFTLIGKDTQVPPATAEREFTLVIKPAPPLVITAPNPMPVANVGSVYGPASFTPSGGLPPYTWSVTPSPAAPGLTFSGGNLTGTPTIAGNYTFTVRLADSASKNSTQTVTLQVLPAGLLEWVTPELLPGGMVLSTYNATLTTRGGFAPVTITRISGNLSGLTQNGPRISGTPTVAGNATFTMQAKDKNGVTANRTFTLPIAPYDLAISADSPSVVNGTANMAFESEPFNADGGDGNYTWSISGTKPAWLLINSDSGILSGTSNATGNWTITVTVKDGKLQTANKTCTISIVAGVPPLLDSTQQLPSGMVGVPYPNPAITAEDGIEPYNFIVKPGTSLPSVLLLNATTGIISGTPTTAGNFTFTVVATGANRVSAERSYTIRIDAYDLAVDIPATIPGQANKPLGPVTLDATGGLEPYTWTVSPALPTGLTLNATTGSITGTPTTSGNTTVTFTVKDARQRTATKSSTFVISAADPVEFITEANLPSGKVASVYGGDVTIQPVPTTSTGITLEGKGGFAPYTYSLKTVGTLPPGLNLLAGKITGTPTAGGTFKFTLVIKDSKNTTAEREFTIIVAPYGMEIVSDYANNLIPAKANQPILAGFQVIGGKPNYTWSIAGTKPAWLSVNSTNGQLTGTPTAAGNTTITLSVRDGASQNATTNLTIAVEAADPLYISTPANLGTVNINTAFSTTLQALGGKPGYTWSLASRGTLPASANLTTTGVLTANSSTALTANFTVRVQDSSTPAANATQAMTLTFRNPTTLAVSTEALPAGRVNEDYSFQLAANGGTMSYEWALTNNSTLPADLDLSLTGWITGKPTTAGNTTLTFQVTDANGAKATRQFVLVIKAATSGNVTASGKLFTDVTDSVNIPQHSVIAVEDFNNDGREDVLARNDDGTLNLLVAQGAFDLRDSTAQAGLTGVTSALVADFNNDGVTDILGTNTPRTEATLYLNNGTGTFTKQVLTGLLTGDLAGYRQVSYADIDADGDLDLVFNINATSGGGIVAVFNQSNISQTASPLFSGKTYLVKTTWKNPSFSITDANGDGKPDILALETNSASISESYTPRPVRLYMNSGNSTADYANPTGTKTLAGFTEKTDSGITLGCESGPFFSWDMDNDGDLDLINGAKDWPWAGAIPRVYINDGTGKYAQKDSPIIQDRFYHWGATTFDADLDGDLDAVWSGTHNFANMYPRMWENGATYLKATTGNGTLDPTKAFFDSTSNWGTTATFAGNGNPYASNNYSNGYAADLDGDGDLDYVYYCWNNFGPQRLFKVFRNDSDLKPANWLKVELVGSISPAQGTGARVEVDLKDVTVKKPSQVSGVSRYEMVQGRFTWAEAKVDAEKRGGHLATVGSENEWNLIKSSLSADVVWLGATDEVEPGNWRWVDGTPWTFSNWRDGEPNGGAIENWAMVWPTYISANRTWNDTLPKSFTGVGCSYLLEYDQPNTIVTSSSLAQYLGADTGSVTKSSLTFGLADKAQAAKVTVYWPSGLKSVLENVAANQVIQIHEIDELPPERPTQEGDVIAWGANPNGETTIPTTLNRVVQIAAGDSSSAALRADGTVSVWGTNWAGQRNVPADLKDVVQVAAGNNHYLALDSEGKVTGWGWNTSNQTTIPATLRRAKFIAAGFNTSYALTGDGRILAWGANDQGQSTIPAGLSDVTALAAGRGHALALKGDGTVVAWGRNDMGQATVPAGLTDVIQVVVGDYHSVALKANGTVVAWGANWTAQATVPAGLTNVVQISAEGDRSLAFKADNSIVNWGFNPDNVTPPPAPGNVLGIAAGAKHGLALVRKIQIAVDGDIPTGTEGSGLDFGFNATGGTGGSYTWSISGDKPAWLEIDSATGKISGTPAAAGTYSFIVRASSGGRWGEIEVILDVIKPELAILWVATSGSDTTGDGTLAKPFASVQKAVDASRTGGTIMVQPGYYTGTVSIVGKSVKLLSQSGEAQTTLSGVKGQINVKNAISLLRAQDGVMKNADKILNRMLQLAIFAQDVTKSVADLSLYNAELTQLKVQLNLVLAERFNGIDLFHMGPNPDGSDIPFDQEKTLAVIASINGSQTIWITQADLNQVVYDITDSSSSKFVDVSSIANANNTLPYIQEAIQNIATLRSTNSYEQSSLALASYMFAEEHQPVIYIAGPGTVIDGFTITGGTGRPQPSSYGFDYYGGGIHCRTTATVKNCIIRGNGAGTPGRDSATFGGAIYSIGKPTDILTVENCVLAENYAWASGGATLTEGSKIVLDRVTVYKNDSRNFFGYQGGVSLANGGKMDLMNSILWANGGDQIGAFAYPYNRGTVATVTYTLSQNGVKSGGIETFTAGTGNLGTDPKLNNPNAGDYSLQTGSPAIDAANPVLKDPDDTRADMGYQAGRRSGATITFDDFPSGGSFKNLQNNRYQYLGAVFDRQIPIYDVSVVEPNWYSTFTAGGGISNALALTTTFQSGNQIDLSFVVPGTSIPASTNFVRVLFADADVGSSVGTLTAFDENGVIVGTATLSTPQNQFAVLQVSANRISRVRLSVDSDGGVLDNIFFNTPVSTAVLNMDADSDGVNDYRENYDGTNPYDIKSFNPLSVGLVAHYPLDGNAKDESGYSKHGTIISGGFEAGRFGNSAEALSITQDANYTKIPLASTQFNGDLSIVAYVKFDDFQKDYPHILFGENAYLVFHGLGPAYQPLNKDQEVGYLEYTRWTGGNDWERRSQVESNKKLNSKQWYQICVTRTVDSTKIFIDGVLCSTASSKAAMLLSGNFIQVGKGYLADPNQSMRGAIDDLKFYNRALSAAEVSQLYSEESGEPNMVLVQGGTLPAGSALANQTVSAFQIARFETTWAEWKQVRTWAAANGYDIGTVGQGSSDNHPVRNVSWYDAVKWLNAKSQMEGLMPVYSFNGTTYKTGQSIPTLLATANGYRLPAEAEWEWAARGGVLSQGYTYSGSNDPNQTAWYNGNINGKFGSKPVGTKLPNELGIHDMSGNVWEFVWNPASPADSYRIPRGGMWNTGLENLALNTRKVNNADYNEIVNWGFRYARNAIGDMVTVQGGTLPESSELAGQKVQAFQIGRTEVTWGEWKTVRTWAAANGYSDLATIGNGTADNHPVRNVSWYDVVKWSNAKSQMEGLSPVYTTNGTTYKTGENDPSLNAAANGYRLPVESEWEWAARGGVASQGYTYSGSNDWTEVAWTQENSSIGTKVVGVKVCNELGIYDMSGNIWEWCGDIVSTPGNPGSGHHFTSGSRAGGGSFGVNVTYSEVAHRVVNDLGYYYHDSGFRLARNIGPKISISGTLPEATLNQAYAGYTFGAVGSTGDKIWSISEGTLPPGMSFSANGTLSGTPTTAGTYTFVIRLESGGYWDEVEVELEVVNNVFSFNPDMVEIASAEAVLLGYPDFSPEKSVLLPKYTIAKDETTFAQWDYVVKKAKTKLNWTLAAGVAGSGYTNVSVPTPQHPVTHITFVDAVLWCNAASLMAGLEPCYFTKNSTGATIPLTPDSKTQAGSNGIVWSKTANGYRLPTGDEWEVAARGGLKSQSYPWGNTAANALNSNWVVAGGYPNNTTPVGTYPRNGFGLSDCAGNVLEMNWDTTLAPGDEVPTTLQTYVVRGGGWQQGYQPRIVFGYGGRPFGDSSDVVGFRLARNDSNMVTVQGGTLPPGSQLVDQTVATFQIGKYEVTWEEWQSVRTYAIANGYDLADVGNGTASMHPVQQVSWYDAVKWCNAKSQMEGLVPVYSVNGTTYKVGQVAPTQSASANGYRLPTESEWEWAARGGDSSQGYTWSGSDDVIVVAWCGENSSDGTKPVGTKNSNELGIHDMSGNVWEWCEDVGFYPSDRRIRGGSWNFGGVMCAVEVRSLSYPYTRNEHSGFRLARNFEQSQLSALHFRNSTDTFQISQRGRALIVDMKRAVPTH